MMSRNKETVSVSGELRVRHTRRSNPTGTPLPVDSPMPLVQVRVQGKGKQGLWREIGQTTTDSAGRFVISSDERDRDRRFRIDVRLHSDALVVRGHLAADWDTVLEQPQFRGDDLENVRLIYGAISDSSVDTTGRLENAEEMDRAEIWGLMQIALKALRDLGVPIEAGLVRPFQVEAVSPAKVKTSYSSPVTRNIHYVPSESLVGIFHELMHIWAYDHTRAFTGGQWRLIWSTIGGLNTHEEKELETTAFHEGFAQFAALQLETFLFASNPPLPLSRSGLSRIPVSNIEQMIRNDNAWQSILTTLVTPELHRFEFGTASDGGPNTVSQLANPPTDCVSPTTSFAAMLRCFAKSKADDINHRIGGPQMKDLSAFLQRIAAILQGTFVGKEAALLRLFDPSESVEPAELFRI
jgi:hypothetical protein